ncbi:MAG: TAXI family TRAP transporter solute-binding subunit [Pseudomonadota bacterium]
MFFSRAHKRLTATFGQGQVIWIASLLVLALVIATGILVFMNYAAPTTLTMVSGPKGSSFERNAEKYRKILAREGVTLKVIPSEGSGDNLRKLRDPKLRVDVGFVLGGELRATEPGPLVSLGSVSYQPLMIFYRGPRRQLISDFKGLRVDIGEEGSGTHTLGLALLKANSVEPGELTLVSTPDGQEERALRENRVDAIFVMGDSTAQDMMRKLMHDENIRLFNVVQADGYARRINYLNKLELPRGALDFGKDLPPEDTSLVGPTVEIIAREGLHPALSDVLLEAVREVHGGAGLFKKRGEFPNAQEHEFRISADAVRYYASGKSYLYRTFPFGIASVITRIIAVVVPLALLLIPALKLVPAIYRWRIESRIHRWYRALLDLEREAFDPAADPARREDLLRHLDQIEEMASKIVVPAAFGDLFYGLRGHICFVRNTLLAQPAP